MPDLPISPEMPNPPANSPLPDDKVGETTLQSSQPGVAPQRPDPAKKDAGDDGEPRPDIASDEVGFRPPDRLPSEDAPASENAALIFERS
jgi:hypothetical protein